MHRVPGFTASGRRSPREWLPALILALLLASSASADVVIKEKSVSEGLGGFGNGTTSRTLIVAGDKSRSEDEATYIGRFKTLAGGGKPHTTVSITRIDKEVIWSLEPEKKQYTELTFAQMREMMQKGMAEGERAAKDAQAGESQAKDTGMTFTVDVKRTGAKETVNGFPAEQVIITCVGRPKNPEKGQENAEIRLVMDEWLTKSAPGAQEQAEFYRRFAEKLGVDAQLSGVGAMAQKMYGNGMKELAAKMKGLGGVAIRSTFTIEGSPEAAAAQKQAAEQGQSRQAEAKAEHEKARQQAEAEEKKQDQEDAKDLASSAATGGGIKGRLGGFLGRKLASTAQKKTEEKVEKKTEEMSGPGTAAGGPLMKVVTEVVSISTAPAPAGSFDVPAGYKLQKKD